MLERAGIADERSDLLRANALKAFLPEDGGDEFAAGGKTAVMRVVTATILRRTVWGCGSFQRIVLRAVFQGQDQRQSHLPFLQIAEDGLTQFFGRSSEIEQIVDELEGEASLMAIFGKDAADGVICAGEDGAQFGAAAEETGGLAEGKVGGFGFSEVDAIERGKLKKLAFDHVLREANENIENEEIALLKGDLEGLHVKPVAGEDAHVIAPAGVGGGAAAAGVGAVDDIVMDERGAVNHLDDGSERNRGAALIATGSCGEQKQSGAQTLAAALAEIAADFGDGLDGFAGLHGDFAFDESKIVAHEIKNFADG